MLKYLRAIECEADVGSHEKAVVSLKYSFDGQLLATASADCRAQIFRTDTMLRQTSLEGEHSLGLNDCCWVDDRLLATASDDNSVVLWDVEVGKAVTTMHGHSSYVYSITANPMNRTILSGGYDGCVMIFDVTSGSCIVDFNAHSEPISSIEYSSFGDCFVTGSQDGFVRLWDSATHSGCMHTIYSESRSPVSSVTYAPNSEYLLVSTLDSKHRLFATKHGGSLPGSPAPMYVKAYKSHINKKYSIFSSISTFHNGDVTGSYLASGSEDNMIYIWDLNGTGEDPIVLEGHKDVVLAVACHPDPFVTQIVSAGKDFSVKVWTVSEKKQDSSELLKEPAVCDDHLISDE